MSKYPHFPPPTFSLFNLLPPNSAEPKGFSMKVQVKSLEVHSQFIKIPPQTLTGTSTSLSSPLICARGAAEQQQARRSRAAASAAAGRSSRQQGSSCCCWPQQQAAAAAALPEPFPPRSAMVWVPGTRWSAIQRISTPAEQGEGDFI